MCECLCQNTFSISISTHQALQSGTYVFVLYLHSNVSFGRYIYDIDGNINTLNYQIDATDASAKENATRRKRNGKNYDTIKSTNPFVHTPRVVSDLFIITMIAYFLP